jgi:hypothetical protein
METSLKEAAKNKKGHFGRHTFFFGKKENRKLRADLQLSW